MYNFYQSKLWIDIQTKVYWNPHFFVEIFGKKYFGLEKVKKIWPFKLKWLQIMWVEAPETIWDLNPDLKKIKKLFAKDYRNIFFQLWFTNEIVHFPNYEKQSDEFVKEIVDTRKGMITLFNEQFGLRKSFRENMPEANIIYEADKSDETFLSEMSKTSNRRVKKWLKSDCIFEMAKPFQYEQFFLKWQEIAGKKWFNTTNKEQFLKLMEFLDKTWKGALFITHFDQEILSGSVCLFDDEFVTYLYGFSSRDKINVWGHQFLKFKLVQRARDNWYKFVNAFGGSPIGIKNHPLASVSKFKESMWGFKVEHYWNFDLVLNSFTYSLFKFWNKIRK